MKFICTGLLVLSLFTMVVFGAYQRRRQPMDVPVYQPYNPIDMTQFKTIKAEVERRIPMTFQEALKMVRRQKMQSCVALIICTLSCDPHAYGSDGDETYTKLIHFNHMSNSSQFGDASAKDIAMFKEAESKGTTHQNHCDLCNTDYPKCRRQVEDLLKTFLNFDIHD